MSHERPLKSYILAILSPATRQQSNIYGNLERIEELLKLNKAELLAIKASSCVILLRETKGHLGDLMFMFASAYGLAQIHACKIYVARHILNELEASFDIWVPHLIAKAEMKNLKKIVSQETVCRFFPELMKPNAVKYFELTGYWQNFAWFINFRPDIIQQFSFRPSILRVITPFFIAWENLASNCCFGHCSISPMNYAEKICSMSQRPLPKVDHIQMNTAYLKRYFSMSNFTWIGIHVKRMGYHRNTVFDEEYIIKAMEYFSKKYPNCLFIMASDDKNYFVHTFSKKKNVIITPQHFSLAEDMATLALCQHSIITVGSFGWWSGFLAGGDVLYDARRWKNMSVMHDCNQESDIPPWFFQLRS